ncbi:hypothetical protein Tco_0672002 [Tanacetum coccineum]
MAAKKETKGTKQRDGKYKHTVDLAKTTFGMRANSCVRELNQKLWDENQVREEPLSATFVAVGVLKFLWNLVFCTLEEPLHHDLYHPNIVRSCSSSTKKAIVLCPEKFTEEAGIFCGRDVIGDGNQMNFHPLS